MRVRDFVSKNKGRCTTEDTLSIFEKSTLIPGDEC